MVPKRALIAITGAFRASSVLDLLQQFLVPEFGTNREPVQGGQASTASCPDPLPQPIHQVGFSLSLVPAIGRHLASDPVEVAEVGDGSIPIRLALLVVVRHVGIEAASAAFERGSVGYAGAVGTGLDCPVLVENDANLAVLGERWCGAAEGVDDVIEVLAGERLGAGLYLGGNLIRGTTGAAGELKMASMVEGVDNTDSIGFLARQFGAAAVASARGPRTKAGRSALFSAVEGDPAAVTSQLVFDVARGGDPLALDVVERVVVRIARVLALLHTLLNPELIVIGGAVAEAGDLLVPGLERQLVSLVDSPPSGGRIRPRRPRRRPRRRPPRPRPRRPRHLQQTRPQDPPATHCILPGSRDAGGVSADEWR
ncbi:ROK family protein [Kribbella sp. NPDC026596]|uniref:ROK family protein n=1 Tax=Kribbella sp. NPDC026596 TaxID=3155122 RepID=UPI0033F0CCDC